MKTPVAAMVTAILINFFLLCSCNKNAGKLPPTATDTPMQDTLPRFTVGVNGHPLNQAAYLHTPVDTQLTMLNDLHLSCYRIDVSTDADGRMDNEGKFTELATAAVAHRVRLLPMLYLKGLEYTLPAEAARQRGYTLGHGFAARYGQHFTYYEMGNEHDWDVLLSRSLYGNDVADYDTLKFRVLAAYLNGVNEGIKAADPTARTIVDGSTGHTGFYRLLRQYNVTFDVIGDHFYLDALFSIPWHADALQKNIAVFDNTKPVWITEANRWKGSFAGGDEEQKELVMKFVEACRANPGIEALLLYELLDEPELPLRPGVEEFERAFGLVKWETPYTKPAYKPVAWALQKQQ